MTRKSLLLIATLCLTLTTSAQENKELFPKFSSFETETDRITEFNQIDFKKNDGFLSTNPNYFLDGNYFFMEDQKKFNYTEYPSLITLSDNTLEAFKFVQIFFSGYLFSSPNECYSKSYIENEAYKYYGFYSDSNKKLSAKNLYKKLNEFYKKEITEILNYKKSNSFYVADMLDNNLNFGNNISNNLFLKINIDNFKDYLGGSKWPGYIQYSMDILNIQGEKIKTYKQVIFFRKKIGARLEVKFGESIEAVGKTVKPAFLCLLNQFLNDFKTQQELLDNNNQKSIENNPNYSELNKIQYDLFNITLQKYNIVRELNYLGVDLEKIKDTNENSTTGKDANTLFNNKNDPNLSAGYNLMGGLFNTIENGSDNITIAEKEKKVNNLQIQLEKLDIARRQIIFSISNNLLSSNLIKYLPKTKDINLLTNEAINNFKKKSDDAKKNLELREKNNKNLIQNNLKQ